MADNDCTCPREKCAATGCVNPVHIKKHRLCTSHYNRMRYSNKRDLGLLNRVRIEPKEKTCVECGTTYVGTVRKRYCSDKCKWRAKEQRRTDRGYVSPPRRKHGPYTCRWCKKPYFTSRGGGEGRSFCGRACSEAHHKKAGRSLAVINRLRHGVHVKQEIAKLKRIRNNNRPKPTVACRCCGIKFEKQGNKVFCSDVCRQDMATKATCHECRKAYRRTEKYQHFCCSECKAESLARARRKAKDRRRKSGKLAASRAKSKAVRRMRIKKRADSIDPIGVLEDGDWKCYICGVDTPRRLRGTYEPNAPEVDHMISLAEGGTHTWDNLACVCRSCNIEKGSDSTYINQYRDALTMPGGKRRNIQIQIHAPMPPETSHVHNSHVRLKAPNFAERLRN